MTWTRASRANPFGPSWRKGWQWWSLPADVLPFASKAIDKARDAGCLPWTKVADEHVLPTAFYHSPLRARLAPYRRFIKWRPGAGSPELLVREDLAAIRASGAWFARKFDVRRDSFFLDAFPAPELEQPEALEARHTFAPDDQMVMHGDVQQLGGVHDFPGDRHIGGGGLGIAARVIVHQNHGVG